MGILGGAGGTGVRIATASDRSRRNSRVIPRPVRRLVVGIRNTPAQIQRGTDCHSQCAHWLRNDREFYRGCGVRAVGDAGPYGGYKGCVGEGLCPSRGRGRTPPLRRVTRGAMGGRPQGSPLRRVTRGAMGGRPQGSPLRKGTRSACVRGRAAALHQGSFLQRSSVLWTTWATLWPRPG